MVKQTLMSRLLYTHLPMYCLKIEYIFCFNWGIFSDSRLADRPGCFLNTLMADHEQSICFLFQVAWRHILSKFISETNIPSPIWLDSTFWLLPHLWVYLSLSHLTRQYILTVTSFLSTFLSHIWLGSTWLLPHLWVYCILWVYLSLSHLTGQCIVNLCSHSNHTFTSVFPSHLTKQSMLLRSVWPSRSPIHTAFVWDNQMWHAVILVKVTQNTTSYKCCTLQRTCLLTEYTKQKNSDKLKIKALFWIPLHLHI